MKLSYINRFIAITLVVSAAACVEPYPAPDVAENISILVVDGFIDGTNGQATVRLSHTTKLTEEAGSPSEEGADVQVRSESGDSFALTELDSGRYIAEGLPIDPLQKYRLYIRARDGQEYVSDYVTVTQTPPIDSVTWRPDGDGVSIMVNTHNDTGESRYYRWEFIETWEYHAPFLSGFKVVDHEVIYRTPEELVFACYKTAPSTTILVASSVRLNEDVIRDFKLTYIPRVSSKISVRYSTLVKQRVIGKAEFEFWQDLQRVTESLGGLFDSQPYEIVGNVHSVNDPSMSVLGYFSAGTVTEQRMFIGYLDLPPELQKRPFHGCMVDTVCLIKTPQTTRKCAIDVPNLPPNSYLLSPLTEGPSIWGYTRGAPSCSDCRLQGGVLTKPSFWP